MASRLEGKFHHEEFYYVQNTYRSGFTLPWRCMDWRTCQGTLHMVGDVTGVTAKNPHTCLGGQLDHILEMVGNVMPPVVFPKKYVEFLAQHRAPVAPNPIPALGGVEDAPGPFLPMAVQQEVGDKAAEDVPEMDVEMLVDQGCVPPEPVVPNPAILDDEEMPADLQEPMVPVPAERTNLANNLDMATGSPGNATPRIPVKRAAAQIAPMELDGEEAGPSKRAKPNDEDEEPVNAAPVVVELGRSVSNTFIMGPGSVVTFNQYFNFR